MYFAKGAAAAARAIGMKKSQTKYILILFLTAIIWGFAFPFQLQGGNALGAFWFNAIRYAIGALSLVPVILIFEREGRDAAKLRRTLGGGAVCGVILFAATTLQQLGMQATQSSAKTGFITGLYMIFVPFCGIFMHRRVRPEAWLGAAVAVLGLYFVSFQSGDTAFQPGDLITLAGALFWTAHIVAIDKLSPNTSAIKFSMAQFVVCGALCVIFALAFRETVSSELIRTAAVPLLYCGIMSSGVAYTCQVIGQRGTEPALASIILCTESVFSAVGAFFILHENLGVRGYIGCALMFVGIILSQLNVFKSKKAA
jgi:drug/metabolite transporter (DMT)-like permease